MYDDTSPTARALLTLGLIQATPGITATRLGERLGVSERAARRYVAILREAEIPIESVRGPYGGYRVGRGLHLPPLVFTATEALGLVMAVLDGHHDAADSSTPVGSALGKIVSALPAPVAAPAETMRRGAAAVPDRAAARPDPETTALAVRACAERRRVTMSYRTEAGSEWEREVDPWAVVVRRGRWYLLCAVPPHGERRAYRIDRMLRLDLLEETVTPPEGLDAVAELEEHLAAGWEFSVRLEVDAPLEEARRWLPSSLGRPSATGPAATVVEGSTSNPVFYAELLALLPVSFRVVEGEEVRAAVRELADRLAGSLAD